MIRPLTAIFTITRTLFMLLQGWGTAKKTVCGKHGNLHDHLPLPLMNWGKLSAAKDREKSLCNLSPLRSECRFLLLWGRPIKRVPMLIGNSETRITASAFEITDVRIIFFERETFFAEAVKQNRMRYGPSTPCSISNSNMEHMTLSDFKNIFCNVFLNTRQISNFC
jgi:hypothetical protein